MRTLVLHELGAICNAPTLGMDDTTSSESLTLSVPSLWGMLRTPEGQYSPDSSVVPMSIVYSARCPFLIMLTCLDTVCKMALCRLIINRTCTL